MENNGNVVMSFLKNTSLILLVFLLIPFNVFSYSDETTHPALTSLTVDFYNQAFSENKLSEQEKLWIIEGSINEDQIPRFFNHFYDPVRDIAWNYENFGKRGQEISESLAKAFFYNGEPIKAVDWVNHKIAQKRSGAYGGDRTWNTGLDYLINNNKEEAFKTLGHILHLLQDMSVPDHTRNDPHPPLGELGQNLIEEDGSPYEAFAKKYDTSSIKELGILNSIEKNSFNIPDFENVEDYLESMANYSSRYFFSKDTIYDENYDYPKIIRTEDDFAYGLDENNKEFLLAKSEAIYTNVGLEINYSINFVNDYLDRKILESYFNLLSKKVVIYGAGVINLFLNSEDKRSEEILLNPYKDIDLGFLERLTYDFSLAGELQKVGKSISETTKGMANLFSSTFNPEEGYELVSEISLDEDLINENTLVADAENRNNIETINSEIIENCSFDSSSNLLSNKSLIINEVAWMGDKNSSYNEWIELKNISPESINIENHTLIDKGEQIDIVFSKINLDPGDFLLLERGDDSVNNVFADVIFQGAISNSNEGLRLYNQECLLIDEVLADNSWPAGDNFTKQTMERINNLSWKNSNAPGGTPKKENSTKEIEINPTVEIDKTTLYKGDLINEIGKGFTPNNTVKLFFVLPNGSIVEDYINTDSQGNFYKPYVMTQNALFGEYNFYAMDLEADKNSNTVNYTVLKKDNQESERQEKEEVVNIENSKEPGEKKETKNEEIISCDFNTSNYPSRDTFIINEIAWMGTNGSSADEWIELKNIFNNAINLEGYQLIDSSRQINIVFPNDSYVSPNDYYLLERTDDNSVRSVTADMIYTGSLANSNEGLRFFDNNCNLVDEVLANPDWQEGENDSKRTMERQGNLGWKTSSVIGGTPKRKNSNGYYRSDNEEEENEQNEEEEEIENNENESSEKNEEIEEIEEVFSEGLAANVVISEIMPGAGTGFSDQEFIELYNPTNKAINLVDWSLYRISNISTESTEVLVNNFSDSLIYPGGYFLISSNEYMNASSSIEVNQIYTSENKLSYTNNGLLLKNNLDEKIDKFIFPSVSRGSSLERYTYDDDNCYPPMSDFEFKGNGCLEAEFFERKKPNPQNKSSMIEPREAPFSENDLSVSFDGLVNISFDWDPFLDHEENSTDIFYKIIDRSNHNKEIFNSSDIGFNYAVDMVGKNYKFEFYAEDKDGMPSEVSTSTIEVPSFLNNVSFYKDPYPATSTIYFIDANYDEYPFVPNIYRDGENYKGVLFYLNSDPRELSPEIITNWEIEDSENLLKFKFRKCSGTNSVGYLLFADSPDGCGSTGGGNRPISIDYNHYGLDEVNNFHFELEKTSNDLEFSSEDYVTPVFYSLSSSGGGSTSLKIVAHDNIKYYFQDNISLNSPNLSSINIIFNESKSELEINWSSAIDNDTLENLIDYEVNFSSLLGIDGSLWENIGNNKKFIKQVESGNEWLIGVRAIDDTGNISNIISKTWSYPSNEILLSQESFNNWSDSWGSVNHTASNPSAASFQSFSPDENFSFDKVFLKIKHQNGGDSADIRLSLFEGTQDSPDFSKLVSETILNNILDPSPETDLVFNFSNNISLSSSKTYWFMLDVASSGHNDTVGLFRNDWQNAISVGGSAYQEGKAGRGKGRGYFENTNEFCIENCSFDGDYSVGESDWYFKLAE
ncbi:MAG: lamin tail domain-containing protein [Candidatus Paceibacterota bacterium]